MEDNTIPITCVPGKKQKPDPKLNQQWENNLSYRALFEQTGECIFIISLDFHYITANQQALDLLGYEEHELVNKPVDEVVTQGSPFENEASNCQFSQFQERILKCKDGSTIPVEISTTIVYDSNNEPTYIQSMARDISIRKNSERILTHNARILSIISNATAKLLQSSDIDTKIPSLLESLGQAMKISCCSIFTIDNFSKTPEAKIMYSWSNISFSEVDIATIIKPNIPELLEAGSQFYSAAEIKAA